MSAPVTYSAPYLFRHSQLPPAVDSMDDARMAIQNQHDVILQLIQAVAAQSGSLNVIFSELVAFGGLVQLWLNGGVLNARNANSGTGGSSGAVQPCHGFCNSPAGVAIGATGYVQRNAGLIQGLAGLTIGSDYWLSTTNGVPSVTKDVTAGHLEQHIGVAISTSTISFIFAPWVQH